MESEKRRLIQRWHSGLVQREFGLTNAIAKPKTKIPALPGKETGSKICCRTFLRFSAQFDIFHQDVCFYHFDAWEHADPFGVTEVSKKKLDEFLGKR